MTRDERQQRIDELERWIAGAHEANADEAMTDDVRAEWERNNLELDEHKRTRDELRMRDERVKRISASPNNQEPGTDFPSPRPSSGPQLISRMNEADVFDLDALRINPLNPTGSKRELRERAMRAVELARFSHDRAERHATQGHVERLVDLRDSEDGYIAKRILTTGSPAYQAAFSKTMTAALRGQQAMLSVQEQRAIEAVRALGALTGSAGGFAVPYFLDPTVIPTSNLSVNPYRAVCRTETIPGNQWLGVTSAGITGTYGYLAENAPSVDNSPVFAQPTLTVQRAQTFVPVSIELTQDWGGLQSELANLIQDAKDDLEATQFSTGVGTTVFPQGILVGSTTTLNTATTLQFAAGDLYALEQAVPPRFRPRAQLIANRFVWNKVRQIDTAGGAGLWVYLPAGLENQVPRGGNLGVQVLGYGANECSAFPATLATTTNLMVMGDMRYFLIVDRVGLDIEIIPHIFQATAGGTPGFPLGQRGFYAFWRNTARVLDPNAFRVLKAL